MSKIIAIPVTLDTKGEETGYIKEQIEKKGYDTTIIDVGVMGKPLLKADITREEVAKRGGKSLKTLVEAARKGANRSEATEVMIEGAKKIVKEIYSSKKVDAILSLGGSTGTAIAVEVMKELPIGVPKLIITTDLDRAEVSDKDIVLMQSPADILGLNSIIKKTFANAIGAILGMVESKIVERGKSKKNLALVGDLEENGIMEIKEKIEETGYNTLVLDVSGSKERGKEKVTDEIERIIDELYSAGKIDGVLSFGGPNPSTIGFDVMKKLPIGMPKIVATTVRDACFVGTNDVTIIPIHESVVQNEKNMKKVLANTAKAIVGMMETEGEEEEEVKPLIGITALGVTTPAVMKIIKLLREKGYESISFHTRTEMLTKLIKEGRIEGVVDLTPTEVIETFLYPGTEEYLGGKDRLEIAGAKGLPQVICPGGLDMLILNGTIEDVPDEFKDRPVHIHGPETVLIRTTKEELKGASEKLVERANRARGPVSVLIPLRGFSEVDKEGQHFYDPATDQEFIRTVKENASKNVNVIEVDAHINDDAFAGKVVEVFDQMFKPKRGGKHGEKI